jgi:hypothetical protein
MKAARIEDVVLGCGKIFGQEKVESMRTAS